MIYLNKWKVWKVCLSKRRYKSRRAGEKGAEQSTSKNQTMDYYECPLCDGWHITRKKQNRAMHQTHSSSAK